MSKATQNVDMAFRGKDAGASAAIKSVTNQVAQLSPKIKEQQSLMQRWNEDSQKTFEKFTATAVAGAAWALAMGEMRKAFSMLIKDMGESLPSLKDVNEEWTSMDKTLGSIKETINDPEFSKLGVIEQSLVLAYRAVNTELAEMEAKIERNNAKATERAKMRSAENRLIDEETAAEKNLMEVNTGISDKVAGLERKWREDRQKRLLLIRQEKAEEMNARMDEISGKTFKSHLAALQKSVKERKELSDSVAKREIENAKKARDAQIQAARDALTARLAAEEANMSRQQDLINGLMGEWTQLAVAMASGQEDAGKAAIRAAIGSAKVTIMAAAAEAAAKAFAAHQYLPFVGIAVGTGMAGLAFAAVEAYLSSLPKAAKGLRIPGASGGESLLHTMRTDETVLDPVTSNKFDRLLSAMEGGSSGGAQIQMTFAPQVQLLEMGSSEARQKVLLLLNRDMERMVNDGLILSNVVRR